MVYNHLIQEIDAYIQKHALISQHDTIILGLSGGPDSVFLLHVLTRLHNNGTINLIAAHLDHEWRTDSQNDVKFCQQLCDDLGVPLVHQKISHLSPAPKFNGSLEEHGRMMRRKFLESVCAQHDGSAIALGHHAQDQQETFFIRLIRGTSLSGLTAMKPKYGLYIRPLLEINKADILAYLDYHTIAYLVDPSNESPAFLRNRIRNTVLPALQECDDRFDKNFFTTLQRLKKAEHLLEQITHETFAKITFDDKQPYSVDKQAFKTLHDALQDRILVYWLCQEGVTFPVHEGFLREIKRFIAQPGSKEHRMHTGWVLVKKKQLVWIEKR